LFLRVPKGELDAVMRSASAEIGPDHLCFERFYQAVAATWPKGMAVVDVGGFVGVQGWLFESFDEYLCVDRYDAAYPRCGSRKPRRCALPENGKHVRRDGHDYINMIREFDIDVSDVLFVCSAVPDERLRYLVAGMRNSVVWYPSEDMRGNGPYVADTIAEFDRLGRDGWEEWKEKIVSNVVAAGYLADAPLAEESQPLARRRGIMQASPLPAEAGMTR
jgi:hypothetical protein